MSDTAVHVSSETGDAVCDWCSATYTRKVYNSKYCSDDCRREVAESSAVGRYHREYPSTKFTPSGLFYRDYKNENSNAVHKYGVKPPTPHEGDRGEVYKVPELNFKRFKENKKIIVFTSDLETKRNGWV